MPDISEFFRPVNPSMGIGEEAYQRLETAVSMIDALARSSNQSLYIIDYHKRNFLHVSCNPLFLCGYTPEQVREMGYAFYELVVPEEEVKMLHEINTEGFGFFYRQPVQERLETSIQYDFHLRHPSRKKLLVNHKLTPVLLTPEGDIWLALCVVSISPRSSVGYVEIVKHDSPGRFIYSFEGRRWKAAEPVVLNDRETDILRLASHGYSMAEIAERLFVDVNTVKFHRKNLYVKLEAKNITEAIGIAANLRLI